MTIHNRAEPDYNGSTAYETFTHNGHWWWSALDHNDDHTGFRHGPFSSEAAAIRNAEAYGYNEEPQANA